jgi:Secretion system C-terminal sorting domain/Photosynthesis system II assembly factor YCF48
MIKNFLLSLIFLLFANFAAAQTWSTVSQTPSAANINSISVVDENTIWIACDVNYAYLSTDGGQTWQLRNSGLPSGGMYGICALDAMNCWIGTGSGSIYHTSDGGNTWTQQIAVSGSFIDGIEMFDANNGVYYADPTGQGQPYQFRYTTDGGTTWTLAPNAPIAANEFGVINAWDWTDQNHFWMGSANINANPLTANVYYTSTGFTGTFNTAVLNGTGGSTGLYYQAIAFTDNNNGLVASNNGDVMKTTDGGATWTATTVPNVGGFAAINMNALKDGSNLIRLSLDDISGIYHVFTTTDFGNSWQEEAIPSEGANYGFQHMRFIDSTLGYAGGGSGYFFKYTGPVPVELTSFTAVSVPGKINLNWSTATETNNRGFEIERKVTSGNTEGQWTTIGFQEGQGTTTEQHQYSYSDNVQQLNATKISYRLKQVDFNGSYVYSQVVDVKNILPSNFALYQNYPNPFNPTTTIKYQIPEDNFVSLKVYNTLGQMVADLVNRNTPAGTHEVNFDASRLTSGVYFYILKVGQNGSDFIKTEKMILMK